MDLERTGLELRLSLFRGIAVSWVRLAQGRVVGRVLAGTRGWSAAALVASAFWLASAGLFGQATATLSGDAAHPAEARGWVETRLYFGLGPAGGARRGVRGSVWRRFLDDEVTPRFPAGLTVSDVYGQWQGKGEGRPERLRSKMLILLYPATEENARRVDAIRAAWKQRTGDQSVLKVTEPAEVSF